MNTPSLPNPFFPLMTVWQNISETLLMPDQLTAILPAAKTTDTSDQLTQPIENAELRTTYQVLHSEIALFNTLQNHLSLNLKKEPLLFKKTLPEYLI